MRRFRPVVLAAATIFVFGAQAVPAGGIDPQILVPGYSLVKVSSSVSSAGLAQLAFDPDDAGHLYAVRVSGQVLRYDFDPVTGILSNDLIVADGLGPQALGLAIHGGDLYVSLDLGGSSVDRPGDGRITRLSDRDTNGVYGTRHDFVHSINKGNHDVNHIQILGDSLYVGIGAVGRTGDPTQENVYTMTIARIVDLTQVDFSGPIGGDFKGPTNFLANETEWVNLSGGDGQLRYYASGFRNPFGIAFDADGDLWVSSLGNSDAGFLSPDYLYKKVPLGAMGAFPPESFGYGPPHISGTSVTPLADLGRNPSPTGIDFVPSGPDAGKVVVTQVGASNQASYPVGKDVLLVDPDDGSFEVLIDDMNRPIDAVRDPFGRLLIADYGDGSIWLLEPPPAVAPPGTVPDGAIVPGTPLGIQPTSEGQLKLTWGASCAVGDDDYAIYQGTIGDSYDHRWVECSTGGALSVTLDMPSGDVYFLIVPSRGAFEGSFGRRSNGSERPPGSPACLPQSSSLGCP